MSELCSYHPSNPDPLGVGGCLNTGNAEDGVVFPGIEVLEASMCYVGRTSIIEAMAELFETTPARVKALMTGDKATAAKVKELQAEVDYLKSRLELVRGFAANMRDAIA
jgi:hypothetical protein